MDKAKCRLRWLAVRPKKRNIFARSNTEIISSNLTRDTRALMTLNYLVN
jgi:hypothetical protein